MMVDESASINAGNVFHIEWNIFIALN